MNDAVGNTLKVGDRVVTTTRQYKELVGAVVVGFTNKLVLIKIDDPSKMTWATRIDNDGVTRKAPSHVCLVITRESAEKEIEDAYQRGINAERVSSSTYPVG